MGNVTSADSDRVEQKTSKKSSIKQRRQQRQQQQQQNSQRRSEGGSSSSTSDQADQELFTGELSFDSPNGSISHPTSSSTRSSPITSRSPWTLRAANASSSAENNDDTPLQRQRSKQQNLQLQRSSPRPSSSQAEFYARSSFENISSPSSATSSAKPIDQPNSPWAVTHTAASSPTTILIATNNDFTSSATEDQYSGFSSAVGSPLIDSHQIITSAPIPVLSIHEPHVQRFSLDTNQLQRLQLQQQEDDVNSSLETSPGRGHLENTDHVRHHHYHHANNPYNNNSIHHHERQQQQQGKPHSDPTKNVGTSPEAKEWLKQKPTRSSSHLIHQYNYNRQLYYAPPGAHKPPSPATGSAASSRKNSSRIKVPSPPPVLPNMSVATAAAMAVSATTTTTSSPLSVVETPPISPKASNSRPSSIMAAALAAEASRSQPRKNECAEPKDRNSTSSPLCK